MNIESKGMIKKLQIGIKELQNKYKNEHDALQDLLNLKSISNIFLNK